MNNKIFVLLLVAIVALSLSAVSAAENTTDEFITASEDVNAVNDNVVVNDSIADDISITVVAENISYGENATVEAKIIPNTTEGNVSFILDGKINQSGIIVNGSASTIFENLEIGKHNIIVNYNGVNSTTSFNVVGNTVTNDTFFDYFYEVSGLFYLRDYITFSDLIFEGNFSNLGGECIVIDKKINLIGKNASLINIEFFMEDINNISISNFTFILNDVEQLYQSIIMMVNSTNINFNNNIVLVNKSINSTDSFIIAGESCTNLTIANNIINFMSNVTSNEIYNAAIYIVDSDNVNILNNDMVISIPSVPVTYDPITYDAEVLSEGICIENSNNLNIDSNNIIVNYSNFNGNYDSIYALNIIAGNNVFIRNNNITTKGHTYTYGINIDSKNMTLDSNNIYISSDNNYAAGIQINGDSTGVIKNNEILIESPIVAYGIYSSSFPNKNNNITYDSNNVVGNSSYVYGIYLSGYNETLLNNNISLIGNFTVGIASSADLLTLIENNILTTGNNIGNASNCGDSIVAETTGIKIASGDVTVVNCTVKTNGDYAINTTGAGSITYNYLIANVGLGNDAVKFNNKTIVENNGPKFIITVQDLVKMYGTDGKLQALLTDAKNNPIVNATITFMVNGVEYIRYTNESGIASMNINLYTGFYEVSTSYNNTTVKSNINITSSIFGDNIIKIFKNGTHFFATFFGNDGKILANTNVTFNINGVFYKRPTNENGTARLAINLVPGEYILTAINPANNEQKGFNVTVLPNVETNDLVKYFKNESQFLVKVFNKDGTLATGTNVTFNINGVFYTRNVTNGTAKLNINLNPGNYVITTMYDGCEVGNNITVNSTLITEDLSMNYRDGSTFNATVLDGQGNPLANQTVIFNVNGVFYNKTSDENGVAKLNINLIAGSYIITSEWNGYQVGRTLTIA